MAWVSEPPTRLPARALAVILTAVLVSATALGAKAQPPVILWQSGSQVVPPLGTAFVHVEASSASTPTYQWRFGAANLTNGSKYSGARTPTLVISNCLAQDAGDYSVVISNRAGVVTSAASPLGLASTNSCVAPPAGMVGWWPGDGDARDLVGTNQGILEGGATATTNGVVGPAFNFDGTNRYVRIPDAPELNPQILSVECWVRFDNLNAPGTSVYPGQQYLVFKQNQRYYDFEGYVLSKDRTFDDVILWEVTSAAGQLVRIDSTSPVTTNVWYHLAATRGSNFIQLYFNGRLEAQTNVNFPQNYGSWPLYFGTSGQAYYDKKLNGCMDEVALYNRVLTSLEVSELYAAGARGKCKGTNSIIITRQPQSQASPPGGTALFKVTAWGSAPLGYQWQFNRADLPGATNGVLSLTNVEPAQTGTYQVVITNRFAAKTSSVAWLSLLVRPELKSARISSNGLFAFTVTGASPTRSIIEASTNLSDWSAVGMVTNLTGEIEFTDPASSTNSRLFYRARLDLPAGFQ